MAFHLKLYALTLPVLLLLDAVWLGFLARGFFRGALGHIIGPSLNLAAAGIFYLLYPGFLLYFAVLPGITRGSLATAMLNGALFGFITYATYDLTNLATIRGWPLRVVIVDILWGTFLGAAVSSISFLIAKRIGP